MADSTNDSLVLSEEVASGVWRLTLNSPKDRNALSGQMRAAILAGLADVRAAGAKVAIVSGDAKAFSSGYKLDPGAMRPDTITEDRERLVEVADFMRAYRDQPLITIAEVRGHCVAGGTDLMIASDLSLAADTASLGVPNVRGVGITLLLPLWSWLVGPHRAKLLTLTGDTFTGKEAAEWGLVTGSFPEDILGERVQALAERIALVPGELLQVSKLALNVAWDTAGIDTALHRAAELDTIAHATGAVGEFWANVTEGGIRQGLDWRDGAFRGGARALDLLNVEPALQSR